jgi:tRNA modification GTPase
VYPRTKSDQAIAPPPAHVDVASSTANGKGIDRLRQQVAAALDSLALEESAAGLAAQRSGDSMRAAAEAIGRARKLNEAAAGEELVAAELRMALGELGKVVGAVYTDDILDRVFSRFCIGK